MDKEIQNAVKRLEKLSDDFQQWASALPEDSGKQKIPPPYEGVVDDLNTLHKHATEMNDLFDTICNLHSNHAKECLKSKSKMPINYPSDHEMETDGKTIEESYGLGDDIRADYPFHDEGRQETLMAASSYWWSLMLGIGYPSTWYNGADAWNKSSVKKRLKDFPPEIVDKILSLKRFEKSTVSNWAEVMSEYLYAISKLENSCAPTVVKAWNYFRRVSQPQINEESDIWDNDDTEAEPEQIKRGIKKKLVSILNQLLSKPKKSDGKRK